MFFIDYSLPAFEMTTLDRFLTVFWRSLDSVMAILLACMVVLVFANVVLRYGFNSGIRPSVELSRLGFVWIVMLGAAVTLRNGEHLSITEVSEALFPRLVPVFRTISAVVILVSVTMLFFGAFKQVLANWNNVSQLTGLPKSLLYVPACISGFLMACITVRQMLPSADKNSRGTHS